MKTADEIIREIVKQYRTALAISTDSQTLPEGLNNALTKARALGQVTPLAHLLYWLDGQDGSPKPLNKAPIPPYILAEEKQVAPILSESEIVAEEKVAGSAKKASVLKKGKANENSNNRNYTI